MGGYIDRNNKVAISHIRGFIMSYPNGTKIYSGVSLHAGEATFQDPSSHSRDTSQQIFIKNLHFFLLFYRIG